LSEIADLWSNAPVFRKPHIISKHMIIIECVYRIWLSITWILRHIGRLDKFVSPFSQLELKLKNTDCENRKKKKKKKWNKSPFTWVFISGQIK